ncbi:DUF4296 domain-containing protein [Pontibacter locisalis]|uniref:DUF4296 domain-containing protein n=1 Tax=Pontibacter locisalis TaxID=1719035 RepID=A0ABW5IH85_9BACT
MKRLFYILFCLVLLGCGNQGSDKPEGLVPQDKMIQILADIHIAESQIETKVIYPDTALMTFNYWQKEILEKHGVEEERFRDTYRYYQDNLKEMDVLYEIIIDTLSVRETKMRAAAGNNDSLPVEEELPAGLERGY